MARKGGLFEPKPPLATPLLVDKAQCSQEFCSVLEHVTSSVEDVHVHTCSFPMQGDILRQKMAR